MAKTSCPISKSKFLEVAGPLRVSLSRSSGEATVVLSELVANKHAFTTGSFGWYCNGKLTVEVDGKLLQVQVGMNLTVVGSKDAGSGNSP
jgi:hypothetical protein